MIVLIRNTGRTITDAPNDPEAFFRIHFFESFEVN